MTEKRFAYIDLLKAQSILSPEREAVLRASGTLVMRNPDRPLTPENIFNIYALASGNFMGIPFSPDKLRERGFQVPEPIGRLPNNELYQKWSTNPLTDTTIFDSSIHTADAVRSAKTKDFSVRLRDAFDAEHPWAVDFTNESELVGRFGYLEKENNLISVRRFEMLADLAKHGIESAIEEKGHATVVDIGSGTFSLERALIARLTPEQRRKTTLIGVDVAGDLLRYGLDQDYIDQGVRIDLSQKTTADDYKEFFPEVDVAIFSEILEHIPHVGVYFNKVIAPWLKHNNAFLIGSVPNPIKLGDYFSLITGMDSLNVLRKPIFDEKNDHYSHFTAPSLAELLTNADGSQESGITSPAVPLDKHGEVCDLFAGLDYPAMGYGLIFWSQYKNEQNGKD
ncbi:MAG TPA: hypothetical protein VE090_03415 [Methylomirabilota bacterium]|nr:hypothetical protein [Methylomirabilota bacterium]